ncbi:MAG: twitching motility protein PilT [Solirubrobacteraceae bacterium]
MSALVLDAGVLLAVDRGDRAMTAKLRVAERSGLGLRSTGVVIAEVWRDAGGRQADLARLLKTVNVRAVDQRLGREAGVLLGKSGVTDAVDATVVAVAATGDCILTSDPLDIRRLVSASRRSIRVVPC